MFGISLAEVVLIFVIMIVFIRPNDLPKFLRSAGRAYGKARKIYREIIGVKEQVMKEINSIADMADLDDNSPPAKPKTPASKQWPAPALNTAPDTAFVLEPTTDPAPASAEKPVDESAEEPGNVTASLIKETEDLPRY